MQLEIGLQPKQWTVYRWMETAVASWIGMGGGRGAAKSGGADRIVYTLAASQPGVVMCVVMRNYDQVRKYHIEPFHRTFPHLEEHFLKADSKQYVPAGCNRGGTPIWSEIDFSYAENLADVERRFRSGNYKYIIVDQAEQFSEAELREMKNACRWPGGGAKLLLLFNMGGAGCIQTLRRWFHEKNFTENEDPKDFEFIHVYPWDNVEWSRDALARDGFTVKDYYSWTDAQRFEYFTQRTDYGRNLNSLPDALRNRDLLSSWDSLEGAYFGRVYDRDSTLIDPVKIAQIQKPWDKRWLSQDWGKAHFCATQWHSMSTLAPSEAKQILGWDVERSLRVIITYRRLIVSELASPLVAQKIVSDTPPDERDKIKRFYLSPDAFGDRDSGNTTAGNQAAEMRKAGMPSPEPADTDRPGGWTLMYSLLWNTKSHGKTGDTVWLISTECPEVSDALPLLMRDPKNLDVVLKTDLSQAKLEQDVSECSRYGLKSMLGTVAKPFAVELQEKVTQALQEHGPTHANIVYHQMQAKAKKPKWGRRY